MLMPKRVKRRKQFRGRMKGKAYRGNTVSYGDWGLVAQDPSWVTSQQIEAARIALTRHIKRGGQVWIKIFPDKPVTAKPAETRMGSRLTNTVAVSLNYVEVSGRRSVAGRLNLLPQSFPCTKVISKAR